MSAQSLSIQTCNLSFESALYALKDGKKVKREIWGGYWYLAKNVDAGHDNIQDTVGFEMKEMIVAVLAANQGVAPAQPYQSDMLANDWQIID